MGSLSIWHWLIVVLVIANVIPMVMILQKAGYSGWWTVAFFVPLLNIAALWVFAFAEWPRLARG